MEQGLCRRQVHDRDHGAAERVDLAELRDAGDRVLLDRAVGGHADLVADRVVVLGRGAGVDRELAAALRPLAGLELERAELRLGVVEGGHDRRVLAAERLAVAPDQLGGGVVLDAAGGRVDLGKCATSRSRLDGMVGTSAVSDSTT